MQTIFHRLTFWFCIKLIIFLIPVFCFEKTNAQSSEHKPFKYFGFHAGINFSNMNFNAGEPPPPEHIAASWKPGFNFGFLLNIPLAGKLILQPEFTYTQRNGADKSLGLDYTADYLSIPVLLNYQVISGFALIAGPQVELLLDARSVFNGQSTNITHDVEERSFGVTGGLEVEIAKDLFISARYFQGLNHIGIGQRSDVKEFQYQVFSLLAGIRF